MRKKHPILVTRPEIYEKNHINLFRRNSITCRKQHILPIKRAETTHGKLNLMQLKVAKCLKMLLLPPTERAVKV